MYKALKQRCQSVLLALSVKQFIRREVRKVMADEVADIKQSLSDLTDACVAITSDLAGVHKSQVDTQAALDLLKQQLAAGRVVSVDDLASIHSQIESQKTMLKDAVSQFADTAGVAAVSQTAPGAPAPAADSSAPASSVVEPAPAVGDDPSPGSADHETGSN